MIPWFQLTTIHLGEIPIQAWGLMVAFGFLVGAAVGAQRARRLGLNSKHVYDMTVWIIVAAMIGGRLFHVVFYDLQYYLANPGEILAVWQGGLSIYGGFAGALLAAWIYLWHKRLHLHDYAPVMIFGLPIGIAIGRLGCFLIHDHPGTATHFFLGVKHPDGVVRHDLGLYESINMFILAAVFFLMARKKAEGRLYLIVFCLWYGVTRFWLDFLRVIDAQYLGLTPGQYLSILLVAVGVFLSIMKGHKNHHA